MNDEEVHLRVVLSVEFEENAKHEEVDWRQRSRALWLKEGDSNTKFFHRTANAHKRYNHIDQIAAEGVTLKDPADIKRDIVSFYQKLYAESEEWRPQASFRECPMISAEENQMMQNSFEEQEI